MRVFTIIEDGERARSVYVRADGDVTVFDRRKFRFRCDIAGAKTTWQIMTRITPHVVAAEARAIEIEALADRCSDDPEVMEYSRATLLMGRDEAGSALVTGEILWIAADRSYAVCEDGFWWTAEVE
jgi:formate-dependent phosphoribosylglycinamide formyltransferase (GAR transformylase)